VPPLEVELPPVPPEFEPPDELEPPVEPPDEPDPEFMPPLEEAPPCPFELLFDLPEFTEFELDPLDEPDKPAPLEPPCPPWFWVEPDEKPLELVLVPLLPSELPAPLWPLPEVWA
jgi:hypothetical protein